MALPSTWPEAHYCTFLFLCVLFSGTTPLLNPPQRPPPSSGVSGGHPRVYPCGTAAVCPHIWKRCSVRSIILGFKRLSRPSCTTSERGGAAVFQARRNFPTREPWTDSSGLIMLLCCCSCRGSGASLAAFAARFSPRGSQRLRHSVLWHCVNI